jgi:broad specificity phosphatase PhoE
MMCFRPMITVLALLWALPAFSQPGGLAQPEWMAALRQGGYVIVLRHGATNPGQTDAVPVNFNDPSKQRQLSDQGRSVAKSIGESMRKLRIPIAAVQTSLYFRAVETGRLLGFGDVSSTGDLAEVGGANASGMGMGQPMSPDEINRRTAALRKLAATAPQAGSNVILVTHKPNLVEAFGKDWSDVREGEASIFKPDGNGGYMLVARVQADEWSKLAETVN